MLDKKKKRQVIILMTILFFVGVSATDIYVPSLPQMVKDFNTVPSNVNLTISSFSMSIAFFVLFTGEISNRFGRRRVLIAGVTIFGVAAFLMSIINNLWLMILFRSIQAIGAAVILIVPRLILKDSMNEQEQIRANGMLLTGLILSPAISPVIGAHLAEWFGWRSTFLFTALMALVIVIWAYSILPETIQEPIKKFKAPMVYIRAYGRLMTNRVFLALTLIYACGVAAYFSFIGVSSYLYINRWHVLAVNYAYIFLGLSVAYMLGNQVMQRLNKQNYPPVKIIGIGVYSTFIGMVVILFSYLIWHGHHEILVISVTCGVLFMRAANALINPPTQIKIMNYFYPNSAQALGLNMCFGFGFSSLATYLVTLFPDFPFASLVVLSFIYIIICVLVYVGNRHLLGDK